MRNGLLLLAGLGLLSGCSTELPSFLGREGGGTQAYSMRPEPLPEPATVPLLTAEAERALHGVILRVEGAAPSQGYYAPALRPVGGGAPDAAGILAFELVAVPPAEPEAIGPEQTRLISAAVFFPNLTLKKLRGFRVSGGGAVQNVPLR